MINICKSEQCCGCTACESICPKHAIEMKEDKEGFCYPIVDKSSCVECGLCEMVCPILNVKDSSFEYGEDETKEDITYRAVESTNILPDSYVSYLKDVKIREASTSGGVFTAIAKYVLDRNGVVFGVKIDEQMNIVHDAVESFENLEVFRGSKYVQSKQAGIYKKVKQYLESGRWVLYTGTPCQVAGLKGYLRKEYDKLITLDIFCHGVGSPLYWKKYTEYMEHKYHSKIKKVRFREKTYGYNSACMAVYFENGKSSHKGHDDDLYWTAFSKCFIFRPSCYDCKFKTIHHTYADFSIGDYWDARDCSMNFQQANGCSLLLAHSNRAKMLLEECKEYLCIQRVELKDALLINGGWQASKLMTSSKMVENKSDFFEDIEMYSIDYAVKKYMPLTLKQQIRCWIKPIVYKLGILNFLKERMRRK